MVNRFVFVFFLLTGCPFAVFSQKPPIDSGAIISWPSLSLAYAISNDGRWFAYTIDNKPLGNYTLVVEATDHSWEKAFIGVESGFFSGDNKKYIFPGKDSLYFLQLGTGHMDYLTHIASYQHFQSSKAEYLSYMLNDSSRELVLSNLITGKEQRFDSANSYLFDKEGNTLLIQSGEIRDSINTVSLQWVSLPVANVHTIWSREEAHDQKIAIIGTNFDQSATQLVFTVQETHSGQPVNTIWYYHAGMDRAALKVSDRTAGIEPGLLVSGEGASFSGNGLYILFKLQPQRHEDRRKADSDAVKVDVWSYRDSVLQSIQPLNRNETPRGFFSVVGVAGDRVIRLENADEDVEATANNSDYVYISTRKSIVNYWWPSFHQKSDWLVSIKDGSRKVFNADADGTKEFGMFSPLGDRLVYYDLKTRHYYSYVLLTGQRVNISKDISSGLDDYGHHLALPGTKSQPMELLGWLTDFSRLFVNDIYGDIWQLDLSGKSPAVNITHGLGRLKHLGFSIIYGSTGQIFSKDDPLLLSAFDTATKYNGFFRVQLGKNDSPKLLTMCACTIAISPFIHSVFHSFTGPSKAGGSDNWVVERESTTEAPNYYLTKDFKTYYPLTDLHPQQKYNWLTAELVTWKQLDGTLSQGILYKPEDFDPHKKYPILFHYYEQMSDRIYEYPAPEFSYAGINIPWFVSRGYLVFTPDIHYAVGKAGQSAVNSVVSAALFLSKRPYVDKRRMGLQGHSFGAFETNYIVSHSHLFAAASEMSGVSDVISLYARLRGDPGSLWGSFYSYYENGQGRMGGNLWQRKEAYLDNSPILAADQVTTPILIIHNKGDGNVPWMQGVQWFNSLWRLRKKAWFLQYDDGGHWVSGKDAVDFNTRLTQFFDYYLKGALPPKWMTRGILKSMKGIDYGLEPDASGLVP